MIVTVGVNDCSFTADVLGMLDQLFVSFFRPGINESLSKIDQSIERVKVALKVTRY
jgi:hypothetical protein